MLTYSLPEESYRKSAALASVRFEHLRDAVQASLAKIADSGFCDDFGQGIEALTKQAYDFMDSDDFARQAQRFSNDLNKIVGNVAKGGETLIRSRTVKPSDLTTVLGAVNSAGNVLQRISSLSESIPSAVAAVGPAIPSLSSKLAAFADAVIELADAARDPLG